MPTLSAGCCRSCPARWPRVPPLSQRLSSSTRHRRGQRADPPAALCGQPPALPFPAALRSLSRSAGAGRVSTARRAATPRTAAVRPAVSRAAASPSGRNHVARAVLRPAAAGLRLARGGGYAGGIRGGDPRGARPTPRQLLAPRPPLSPGARRRAPLSPAGASF